MDRIKQAQKGIGFVRLQKVLVFAALLPQASLLSLLVLQISEYIIIVQKAVVCCLVFTVGTFEND